MRNLINLSLRRIKRGEKGSEQLLSAVFQALNDSKRRGRDSNPRYLAVNTLSKRARSATLTPLRKKLAKK